MISFRPTLLLILAALAAAATLPAAADPRSLDPPLFWTDQVEYPWIAAHTDPHPYVCMNLKNVDPDTELLLLNNNPYTIYDEAGHKVLSPMSLQGGIDVPPGATYRACLHFFSEEAPLDAIRHDDPRWLPLTRATFAPPGTYTIVWEYTDSTFVTRTLTAQFLLTEVGIG